MNQDRRELLINFLSKPKTEHLERFKGTKKALGIAGFIGTVSFLAGISAAVIYRVVSPPPPSVLFEFGCDNQGNPNNPGQWFVNIKNNGLDPSDNIAIEWGISQDREDLHNEQYYGSLVNTPFIEHRIIVNKAYPPDQPLNFFISRRFVEENGSLQGEIVAQELNISNPCVYR